MSDGHYLRIFEKIMILYDAWLMVPRLQSDTHRVSDFFERTKNPSFFEVSIRQANDGF